MSDLEFDDSFKQLVYLDVWLQRLLTKFDSWDMQAVKQFKQRASKLPGAMKNSLTPRKAEFAQQQAVEEFERRMYAYYLDQIVPDVHGMNKSARYLVLSKRLVQGVGRDKDINSELALTLRANRIGLPAGTIILSAVNRITKSPPQYDTAPELPAGFLLQLLDVQFQGLQSGQKVIKATNKAKAAFKDLLPPLNTSQNAG
ncbi:MAG: hypothetical protein LQ337_006582 [Flavoplaca oasis]|nr:MAG: hypothetical protein LQ337_006582 [Flavoplaca oasis]